MIQGHDEQLCYVLHPELYPKSEDQVNDRRDKEKRLITIEWLIKRKNNSRNTKREGARITEALTQKGSMFETLEGW